MHGIRDFVPGDAAQVNALGVATFEAYSGAYSDWPAFRERIAAMSSFASSGEIIVARRAADV